MLLRIWMPVNALNSWSNMNNNLKRKRLQFSRIKSHRLEMFLGVVANVYAKRATSNQILLTQFMTVSESIKIYMNKQNTVQNKFFEHKIGYEYCNINYMKYIFLYKKTLKIKFGLNSFASVSRKIIVYIGSTILAVQYLVTPLLLLLLKLFAGDLLYFYYKKSVKGTQHFAQK